VELTGTIQELKMAKNGYVNGAENDLNLEKNQSGDILDLEVRTIKFKPKLYPIVYNWVTIDLGGINLYDFTRKL